MNYNIASIRTKTIHFYHRTETINKQIDVSRISY